MSSELSSLPRRIRVQEVISGRYQPGKKPISWDSRKPGVETIRTTDGETLSLFSGGGQATPAPGWELLLTKQVRVTAAEKETPNDAALAWTLYGIPKESGSDPAKAF